MKAYRYLAAVVVAVGLTTGAIAQADSKYNLTLTGASPGGLWSLLGAGINAAVAEAYPGSTVTYQTSGGGLANVALVASGQADLGIAHNIELKVAKEGKKPFSKPVPNLRVIAYLYNWAPMQLVMLEDFARKYGIHSIADLAKKKPPVRFAVNQRGNMVQAMNKAILEAYGVTYKNVEAWGGQIVYAASKEQGKLLSDRRIDMLGNGVFAPHKSILQASNGVNVVMLGLSDEAVTKVAEETGADPYVVKAGSYEWLTHDIKTVALGAALVASDSMSDQDAYNLTKALVEHIARLQGVHKSMHALTPKLMASLKVIPYHPGAVRYYREAGLMQ